MCSQIAQKRPFALRLGQFLKGIAHPKADILDN
jgi:hypothetical protein